MRTKTSFRYARRTPFTKWTHEATATAMEFGPSHPPYYNLDTVIVPALDGPAGPRKVKNFTISLNCDTTSASAYPQGRGFGYVLVYVPKSTMVSTPDYNGTTSVYEPSQYLISCGLVSSDTNPIRIRSSMSRILHEGDSIHLVLTQFNATAAGDSVRLNGVVEYSITQ